MDGQREDWLRLLESHPELRDSVYNVDVEPVNDGWGHFGDYELVGHGSVTNPASCGKYRVTKGCLNVPLHNRITLDGVNYAGKVYTHKVHFGCDKPSCPVCYLSWAKREADKIEQRLVVGSKRFGKIEHIVASVPIEEYELSFEDLRSRVVKALYVRDVVGGILIFHAFRYNDAEEARSKGQAIGWYWSPHFHCLGFVLGGYGRCRGCKKGCVGCDGFEGRTRKAFESDGYIVKVLGERMKSYYGNKPNIYGTAYYQLNHSCIKVGVKRFHVATWFGCCSYRKLKVTIEKRKLICPICKHECVDLRYFGSKSFVVDKSSPDYRCDSFEDYEENGRVVWVEWVKGRSGSYEE